MFQREVLCATLVAGAAACHSMATIGYPQEYIDVAQPERVWVTRFDDSVEVITHPVIHGDTLSGFTLSGFAEMPISDVKFVRANVAAPVRTVLLVGAATLGAGALVVTLTGSKSDQTSNVCTNSQDQQAVCPK